MTAAPPRVRSLAIEFNAVDNGEIEFVFFGGKQAKSLLYYRETICRNYGLLRVRNYALERPT